MKKPVFRHEYKYEMNCLQTAELSVRLKAFLESDRHSENRKYRVRSLYFDDYRDTGYYDNENGTDPREKFRIRLYNGDTSFLRLECKRKERDRTQKESCRITVEQCRSMMEGKPLLSGALENPVLEKFTLRQKTAGLKPKVIVEYDRIPFVYPEGNVRITIDSALCAGTATGEFLQKEIFRIPVMGEERALLEVKYDTFLPDVIYHLIQMEGLERSTFSKYYICRGGLS